MNDESEEPTMTKKPTTTKPRFYSMSFARVYPMYVKKAESKGRTKVEVDEIILWLTGHTAKSLQKAMDAEIDIETFYAKAPRFQPNARLIKGVVCGVRVEEIEVSEGAIARNPSPKCAQAKDVETLEIRNLLKDYYS
jgi:hypothetical protein